MDKSLRLALPLGFDVRLLELPSGEDPDTWCLKVEINYGYALSHPRQLHGEGNEPRGSPYAPLE